MATKRKPTAKKKASVTPIKKPGPAPYAPTPELRIAVESAARFGGRDSDIADEIGISEPTLAKHFRQELNIGRFAANQQVKETAFNMATSGKDTAMTIFWLKVRCHWKETSIVQVQDLPAIEVK